jgi:tRNA (guanosine-2'-O-)-methyltransferase
MENSEKAELIEYLSQFVSDHKNELFTEKIAHRTRHVTVVIENLFQEHNTSAVLRTADCFGVQDVHIIQGDHGYKINDDIALGASKWLTIHSYKGNDNNTESCLHELKARGYTIVATTPHRDDTNLEELDISGPVAIVFGTELEGISPTAVAMADKFMKVPMFGFTESLNISVCAGICMHHLSWKLRQMGDTGRLSETERLDILLGWMRNALKHPEQIEQEFYKRREGMK